MGEVESEVGGGLGRREGNWRRLMSGNKRDSDGLGIWGGLVVGRGKRRLGCVDVRDRV